MDIHDFPILSDFILDNRVQESFEILEISAERNVLKYRFNNIGRQKKQAELQGVQKNESSSLVNIIGRHTLTQTYSFGNFTTLCTRKENSRRHHRHARGTIRAEVRNQTDAVYLNGPIFSDFGPKMDFF